MTALRSPKRPTALLHVFALMVFASVVWFGLEMNRGLLLSSDFKSVRWPWAAYYQEHGMQAPIFVDSVLQFVPWLQVARRELLDGRVPLWNPHQEAGVPLLGNAQSALGTPLVWPVLIFGVEAGWNVSLLLRVLLAAAGAFLWLRDLGRSRVASGLGAVAFSLSGPFVAWLGHPHVLSAAPMPLLLLSIRRLVRDLSRGGALALALTTFLVLAGGHPETYLMVAILAAAVLVFEGRTWRARARAVAAAVLGAGLAAPLVLPFVEYLGESEVLVGRVPFTLELASMIRFIRPKVPVGHPIENAATVSLVVLVLSLVGLLAWRDDRQIRYWSAVAVVFLLVTYANPVAWFLAVRTPVNWSRVLLFLPLALGVLSSAGLDVLRSRLRTRRGEATGLAIGCALVAVACAELIWAGRGVHAVTPPEDVTRSTPLLDRLMADPEPNRVLPIGTFLTPNLGTSYGIDDVRGYDAITPRGWRLRREEIGAFHLDMMSLTNLRSGGGGLDFWNVKYLLVAPNLPFDVNGVNARLNLDLMEVYSGPDGRIWENRHVLPRARLIPAGEVAVERHSSTAWGFLVNASRSSTLVIANPYFPGWVAYVDGRRQVPDARPGDAVEVSVPGGRHRVDLVYEPVSFRVGLVVAAFSALAAAVIALAPVPRRGQDVPAQPI